MRLVAVFLLGLTCGIAATWAYQRYLGPTPPPPAYALPEIIIGDPKAPVLVIEYSSLGCGHCAQFKQTHWPTIKEKFIQTGRVKWALKPFPMSLVDMKASLLAYCHNDPTKLLETYYKTQSRWMESPDPLGEIVKIAQEEGLEPQKIALCLQNDQMVNALVAQRMYAQTAHNVEGTPAFLIGKVSIPGIAPLNIFETIIKQAESHLQSGKSLDTFEIEEDNKSEKSNSSPQEISSEKPNKNTNTSPAHV
jgi:protein-disulfide isomerase